MEDLSSGLGDRGRYLAFAMVPKKYQDLAQTVPHTVWEIVDPWIFRNHKQPAMQELQKHVGDLRNVLYVFCARYDFLRETDPSKFTMSHDNYWEGFSS